MIEQAILTQRRPVNSSNFGPGQHYREAHDPTKTSQDGHTSRSAAKCRGTLAVLVAVMVAVAVALILLDVLVTSPIDPEDFSMPSPPEFVGALSPNKALAQTDRLYEGRLRGPESITLRNGKLYTGTADGKILEIVNDEPNVIATLGTPPCGRFEDEPTCGRPLGMRFDKNGELIVIDTYLGIFKVNVDNGKVEQLYSSSTEIDGKRPRFLNDLDIASNGDIYISDSSTKWDRRHNRMDIMETRPHGRLLKFDPRTRSMSLLADGFYFANGVQLSPDEDYILIAETSRCRIRRYYLKGPKAGQLETFADNLPGLPDNIRRSAGGGYWLGIALARLPGWELRGYDFLASRPWIRRLMAVLLSQDTMLCWLGRPYGLLLELNDQGEIIRSLHDPQGQTVPAISEVEDDGGVLYMGSYFSPFIGKLHLKNI